jgi:hypothetical protein
MAKTKVREPLDTKEAAAYVGRSPGTLANWRWKGIGPKYFGQHTGIRYRPEDLDAWIEANSH